MVIRHRREGSRWNRQPPSRFWFSRLQKPLESNPDACKCDFIPISLAILADLWSVTQWAVAEVLFLNPSCRKGRSDHLALQRGDGCLLPRSTARVHAQFQGATANNCLNTPKQQNRHLTQVKIQMQLLSDLKRTSGSFHFTITIMDTWPGRFNTFAEFKHKSILCSSRRENLVALPWQLKGKTQT